jgi:hypothetical protein
MNLQKQKSPEGAWTYEKHNEHQDTTISRQKVWLISSILEQSEYQSDQQRQAIMRLYQLTLDAHQAETLDFLDPPDEAVALDFLDSVDTLAVAPIFDDDTALYREALLAARRVVCLMNAGRITFRVSSDGA